MDVRQLLEKIDHFLLQALNHRYNSQAHRVTFLEEVQLNCQKITNINRKLELSFQALPKVRKLVYRLPQTRIYYTLYQSADVRIIFIDYFNVHFVAYQLANQTAKLVNRTRLQFRSFNPRQRFLASLSDVGLWVFAPSNILSKLESPLSLLHTLKIHEYKINPVAQAQTENTEFLATLDANFARLPYITMQGNLQKRVVNDPLWAGYFEWFVQNGRFKPLLALLKNKDVQTRLTQDSWGVFFLHRLKSWLQLNDQAVPMWLQKVKPSNQPFPTSFTELLYTGIEGDPQALAALQHFWETMQTPALEFYWQKKFNDQPWIFFSFLLLAVRHQFFWAEHCYKKLREWATDSQKPLLDLLFQQNQFVHVTGSNPIIAGAWNLAACKQAFNWGAFSLKFYRFGKNTFSEISSSLIGLTLKIDRFVRWQINRETQTITVLPVLWRPPSYDFALRFQELKIDGWRIQLPLIWEQFVLQINQARLKWIRKKRRFQVSFKIPKAFTQKLILEGHSLTSRNVYGKLHFDFTPQSNQWQVEVYDAQGVHVHLPHANLNHLTLRGAALDAYGILRSNFNLKRLNSRRNHQMVANALTCDLIPVDKLPMEFTLTARRCEPRTIKIEPLPIFVRKFFQTAGRELVNTMMVWIQSEKEIFKIAQIFEEQIGFVPKINVTLKKNFNPTTETFNLLISLRPEETDRVVIDWGSVKLMAQGKGKRIFYFWLQESTLPTALNYLFFIQKTEKI